jgi:DCN1-like protein 1/2
MQIPNSLLPPEQESAIGLWNLLLEGRFPLLQQWCQFIQEQYHHSISKDTWALLLDFIDSPGCRDLSQHDESEPWPVIIDEFVAFLRSQ